MFRKSALKAGALAGALAATLTLSGCGTTPGERLISGGLIGAGTGAAVGSVTGDAGRGAIIGGLGGAALGALTTPRTSRYGYAPRCVRWSSYTGRCLRWV